jgi:hypothetical protein
MPKPPQSRSRVRKGRIVVLGAAGVVAAAVLAAAAAPFARADPITLDPLDGALGFNAFIEQGLTRSSLEAEGPVATGGDLTIDGVAPGQQIRIALNCPNGSDGTEASGIDDANSPDDSDSTDDGATGTTGTDGTVDGTSGTDGTEGETAGGGNAATGNGGSGGDDEGFGDAGGRLPSAGSSLRPVLSAAGALLTVGAGAVMFAAIRRHGGS